MTTPRQELNYMYEFQVLTTFSLTTPIEDRWTTVTVDLDEPVRNGWLVLCSGREIAPGTWRLKVVGLK